MEMDTSTMTIKDGNDTSDRFNYKVHALMGDYDPTEGMPDNEDQDGNIMKALLTFPTQHVFDVVGRLSSNDESDTKDATNEDDYADSVKRIVFDTTGDDDMECEVIPRGKKFVKVRCTAKVESTTMINTIYDELGRMESTVMKF
jgi:putative lipoic acid-binding regulatory protein